MIINTIDFSLKKGKYKSEMYKILKNVIPLDNLKEPVAYISSLSKNTQIKESEDQHGKYLFQDLTYNQVMSSEAVKKILFSEKLIKEIKNEVGNFYLINYVHGKINSFGSKSHRDGQSFGYNENALYKSSKIIKVLFYLNLDYEKIPKGYGIDVNFFDFNIASIFPYKRLSLKLNFYYEYYFRSRFMKTLNINMGDVILMDNNCWHRGSFNKLRPKNKNDYKPKKILLDYEIVTDKEIANDYAKYCRSYFVEKNEKNDLKKLNTDYLDNTFLDILKKNNIEVINV